MTFAINKAANTLAVTGKKKAAVVKYNKLRNAPQKIKASKVIKATAKGQGAVKNTLSSAKKGKKNFKKFFKVNAKTGLLTVKKGLAKGTYSVTVKVQAKGNANYKASKTKKVTFKVKVS